MAQAHVNKSIYGDYRAEISVNGKKYVGTGSTESNALKAAEIQANQGKKK